MRHLFGKRHQNSIVDLMVSDCPDIKPQQSKQNEIHIHTNHASKCDHCTSFFYFALFSLQNIGANM